MARWPCREPGTQGGYLSSTGTCFDIGATVRAALASFQETGNPYSGSTAPCSAGNGSLMRLAPVVLFAYPDVTAAVAYAADSSRTTHAAAEAVESCQMFAALLCSALAVTPKEALLDSMAYRPAEARLSEMASGRFIAKTEGRIRGTGYCLESLEAAVLRAVNLGEDADSTGAIVGQLAGAYYGARAIPPAWLNALAMRDDIEELAGKLFERRRA
ncbi:ADP-ribosylglycohydrolase family protein [Janthinobacterium sp. DSP2-3-3]|uniref:ADP-ribosylglycohydrolase family protein n=1 Tax=Janthinobacterium sp. DSP2-3-3 TaxID=2804596 RepID=UPI003CEB2A43